MKILTVRSKTHPRIAAAVVVAALSASSALAANYLTTLLADGPIAYWPFNETNASPLPPTVSNSTALAATGYAVADVVLGQPGIVGNCARFNNAGASTGYSSSKIDVPWQAALNPNPPFSVEFWAKPNSISTDSTGVCPLSSMNPFFYGANRSGYIFYLGSGGWQMRIGGENSYAATAGPTTGGVTPSTNLWEHIVGEYDGTSNYLYINGALAARGLATPGGFKTNAWVPTRIGSTFFNGTLSRDGEPGSGNRGWDGWVDEVAVYNTLLTASQIAAHFAAATTNNAGYHAQIRADNPVAYWTLDEPAYATPSSSSYPVAVNWGTDGAADNGTNTLGALADQPGAPYNGFTATNHAVAYSGEMGSLVLGATDNALADLAGSPVTYMAWIMPTQIDGWRTIIEQGFDATTGDENYLRIGDTVDWEGTGTPNTAYYEVGQYNGGAAYATAAYPVPAGDVGNWIFLAGTWDGTNWNLYRNSVLVAQYADDSGPVSVPGNPPWSVGSLSNPNLEDGWYFSGSIEQPAIFNVALSQAQITALYNAAQPPPEIIQPPVAPSPIYVGASVTLSVWADGGQPLSYQWYSNSVKLTGQTATNVVLSNLTPAASGTYSVVVTNAYGAVTSSTPLVVLNSFPPVGISPTAETRWTGFPFSFAATGLGGASVEYIWSRNGTVVSSSTSSILTGTAAAATAGTYTLLVTNSLGNTATSSVPAVLAAATIPSGYAGTILGDRPIAFYRLDELSGTVAHDYAGGNDGQYFDVTLDQPGYSPIDPDPAISVLGVLNSDVGNIAPTAINFAGTTNFSIEAWANGPSGQINGAGVVAKGTGNVGNGGIANEQFLLSVNGEYYAFEVRSPANTTGNGYQATGLIGPDGTWHYLAGVWDGANVNLYIDGSLAANAAGPSAIRSSVFPISIGAERSGNDPNYDLDYAGSIDEVAIYNYALTPAQVQAHYSAAYGSNLKVAITLQPLSLTNYAGLPATFSVSAYGSVPLAYQWNKSGSAISGQTTPSFTIPSIKLTDAGTYSVTVSNPLGATNSANVTLTVLTAPTNPPAIAGLVMHLPFNGNFTDVTGRGNNATLTNSGTGVAGAGFVPGFFPGHQGFMYQTVTNKTQTNATYATIGVVPDLQFGTNGNFTVAMWVLLPIGYVGDDLPFFTDAVGSTFGHGYVFAPSFGQNGAAAGWPGGWAFSLFDTGTIEQSTAQGIGVWGDPNWINDGSWHHLAYVFDRKLGETTYLDGISYNQDPQDIAAKPYTQSGTTAAAALDIDTTNPATIGQDPTGLYPEMGSATLADLAVWKRALTPLEVASIYTAAVSNQLSFTGVPLTFTFSLTSTNSLLLNWNEGMLQSSINLGLPGAGFTDLTPNPPYIAPLTGPGKFFRVKF